MGSSQSTQAARRAGRKIATVTRAISTGSAQAATRVSREGSSRDLAGSAGPSASTAEAGRDITNQSTRSGASRSRNADPAGRELPRGRAQVALEGVEGRRPHQGVLLSVATAHSDAAHHLPVDLDREAAHEHREAARMHGVDAEGFVARKGRT